MPWRGRPSSSVKFIFSQAVKRINAKIGGYVDIHHISANFVNINYLFSFLIWEEWECNFKTLLPPQLWFFFNQTFCKCSWWHPSQKLYLLAFWNLKSFSWTFGMNVWGANFLNATVSTFSICLQLHIDMVVLEEHSPITFGNLLNNK